MSQLCSQNQTYIMMNPNLEKIVALKGKNEIIGKIGIKLDRLFIKKNLRKCTLIGENLLGEKMPNGTYTGNLGLLQQSKGVVYLKNEVPVVDEEWLSYGLPFASEKFRIIEEITEEMKKKEIFDLSHNFNFGFTLIITFLSSILISFLISIIFKEITDLVRDNNRIRKIREILFSSNLNVKRWRNKNVLSGLGLFLLFYNLHLWFVELMVINNIKTNKVVIDTSSLIINEDDALNTKRTLCLMNGNSEMTIVRHSSKENVLRRLYERKSIITEPLIGMIKKAEGNRCIVEISVENMGLKLDNLFSIISESIADAIGLIASARENLNIWYPSKPIFEISTHLFIRNEKYIRDQFWIVVRDHVESGLSNALFQSWNAGAIQMRLVNQFYINIEKYLNDNIKFEALSLQNFENIFLAYFAVCGIIILCFLIHHLVILISRIKISIKFI